MYVTAQDPIRLMGGDRLYGYVYDPNAWLDALGLAKIKNKVDGDAREAQVLEDLKKQYPDAEIVKERYLRDSNGKSIKDPLTDSRRRIDFAVIQDGKVLDMIEVTSPTADKTLQVNKEARIRATGDVYIRDSKTKKLYNVTNVETRRVNCH